MPAFQPYWGKPAVRNDRGDRGNVGIMRSPLRASILPDRPESFIGALQLCVYAKTDGADSKIGSGDLPVGQFVDRVVESYFGFSEKYFCSRAPQIISRTFRIPPHRGAYRDRHGRGEGCGGRGSVRRETWVAGRVGERPVSDQTAS